VDSQKCFLDLYLRMHGSTNDLRVLRCSSLYHRTQQNNMFEAGHVMDGFLSFILGNSGYPVLPWLVMPHKNVMNLTIIEILFNRRLKHGRCVVLNAFGILEQTFCELLVKFDLIVTFLLDVILCCALLYNISLARSRGDVKHLL
jgi:hypothetical protein